MLEFKHCGRKVESLSPQSEREKTTSLAVEFGVDVGSNDLTTFTSARTAKAVVACRTHETVRRRIVEGAVNIRTVSTACEGLDTARRLAGRLERMVDPAAVGSPPGVTEALGERFGGEGLRRHAEWVVGLREPGVVVRGADTCFWGVNRSTGFGSTRRHGSFPDDGRGSGPPPFDRRIAVCGGEGR